MAFDVERGFISKLLQTKDISTVKDSQIKLSYFSGDNKSAFQYIQETVLSTGEVPTVRAFKRRFPNYKLEKVEVDGESVVGTEENLKYWCDELRVKVKHNTLVDAFDKSAEFLQDFDTEEAYKAIKKSISYIENEVVETTDIDITQNTEDRVQDYLKRKENQGMRGLPTGFKHLDYLTKGLENSTLTTVIANTGIGKTWFQVILGANLQLQNCRVLQMVTEMSEDIMRDRYEAVLFSKCYEGMNYNDFKSGRLPHKIEELYFQFLREDLPSLEPLFVVTATSPMGVSAEIDKYKPDIVLIDSAYLMADDMNAKDDWLRVAHITRDLKKLAKSSKLPILINTQADKNSSKKTGPEMGNIMYTQAIGQDSDNVLTLFRDEVMLNDHEMGVRILKQREGTLGKLKMNWDFESMDFSEIYIEDDDSDEKDNTVDIDDTE